MSIGITQGVNIERDHTAIPCFNPLVVPKTCKWHEINILYYITLYYILYYIILYYIILYYIILYYITLYYTVHKYELRITKLPFQYKFTYSKNVHISK